MPKFNPEEDHGGGGGGDYVNITTAGQYVLFFSRSLKSGESRKGTPFMMLQGMCAVGRDEGATMTHSVYLNPKSFWKLQDLCNRLGLTAKDEFDTDIPSEVARALLFKPFKAHVVIDGNDYANLRDKNTFIDMTAQEGKAAEAYIAAFISKLEEDDKDPYAVGGSKKSGDDDWGGSSSGTSKKGEDGGWGGDDAAWPKDDDIPF